MQHIHRISESNETQHFFAQPVISCVVYIVF